jgi:glutathione S-transferase
LSLNEETGKVAAGIEEQAIMKLYTFPGSGNAYKLRVLLALLKQPYETVSLDAANKEYKQPHFLKINPRGEVPVIEDNGTVIWDSGACLVYVARQYGGETWLPSAAAEMAEVMQWLVLSASEIQFGLQYGRRGVQQNRWTAGDLATCHATANVALNTMESRLRGNDWLALNRPTIADIACFPYVETAPEAKVPLEPYPGVLKWLDRCRALPGWPKR